MANRRTKSLAAALLMALLLPAAGASAQCVDNPGDVNADGNRNISDIQCMILTSVHLLGNPGFPELPSCLNVSLEEADLNCDTGVDLSDIILVITYAVGESLSPLVDADANDCPDSCEGPGKALVVPATIVGSSTDGVFTLESLGTGVPTSGVSTGTTYTLEPKAVGLTE